MKALVVVVFIHELADVTLALIWLFILVSGSIALYLKKASGD